MEEKIEVPQFPELEFEEKKHVYTLRGMELPSVTKIMQPLSSYIYSRVDAKTLNAAADKGTAVHGACESYIKFGIVDIPTAYSGYMDAFLKWYAEYSPMVLASETKLYISLNGDTFEALKEDFDKVMNDTLGNMEMKGSDDAVVTIKIKVSLEKQQIRDSENDCFRDIIKPTFDHDVSSVLQIKDKRSGSRTGGQILYDIESQKYYIGNIDDGQTSFMDEDGNEAPSWEPGFTDAAYEDVREERTALPSGVKHLPAPEEDDVEEDEEYQEYDEPEA